MKISCSTCKHGQRGGCSAGWCIDREKYNGIPNGVYFSGTLHCINREYYYWETIEFIEEKEMEI
jgi:hypothetical protein